MPTEYITTGLAVLKDGSERTGSEIRIMTGNDLDTDTDVTPKDVVAQLGVFDYETGDDIVTVDITAENAHAISTALAQI